MNNFKDYIEGNINKDDHSKRQIIKYLLDINSFKSFSDFQEVISAMIEIDKFQEYYNDKIIELISATYNKEVYPKQELSKFLQDYLINDIKFGDKYSFYYAIYQYFKRDPNFTFPISEDELKELGKTFSELVLRGVLKAPFIHGSLETLEKLKRDNIPAYVVSGTPDEEIEYIVKERGLTQFFEEVHGSPRQKHEIITDILTQNGFENSRCLFIGDAMSDYRASQATGVSFLGLVKEGGDSPFPKGTVVANMVTL